MPSYFYRGTRRTTVEEALTIDLNRLLREWPKPPGIVIEGELNWNWRGGGSAAIGYRADLRDEENSWLRLKYSVNGEPETYRIYLTTTRPNYGGVRWWFICPITGDRAYKLHSVGGRRFASQRALNLGYVSQQESKLFGSLTRAQKIRKRLGGNCDVMDMLPKRPKGMWRRTYEKQCREYRHALDHMNMQIGGRFTL